MSDGNVQIGGAYISKTIFNIEDRVNQEAIDVGLRKRIVGYLRLLSDNGFEYDGVCVAFMPRDGVCGFRDYF